MERMREKMRPQTTLQTLPQSATLPPKLPTAGNTDAAKQILALAVQAGRAAGFPGVDQIEKTLASL